MDVMALLGRKKADSRLCRSLLFAASTALLQYVFWKTRNTRTARCLAKHKNKKLKTLIFQHGNNIENILWITVAKRSPSFSTKPVRLSWVHAFCGEHMQQTAHETVPFISNLVQLDHLDFIRKSWNPGKTRLLGDSEVWEWCTAP